MLAYKEAADARKREAVRRTGLARRVAKPVAYFALAALLAGGIGWKCGSSAQDAMEKAPIVRVVEMDGTFVAAKEKLELKLGLEVSLSQMQKGSGKEGRWIDFDKLDTLQDAAYGAAQLFNIDHLHHALHMPDMIDRERRGWSGIRRVADALLKLAARIFGKADFRGEMEVGG